MAEEDLPESQIRYEVLRIGQFVELLAALEAGARAKGRAEEAERLIAVALLEATLLHLRCVIEFLGESANQWMRAKEYASKWDPQGEKHRFRELEKRLNLTLAHLKVGRTSGEVWRVLDVTEQVITRYAKFVGMINNPQCRRDILTEALRETQGRLARAEELAPGL